MKSSRTVRLLAAVLMLLLVSAACQKKAPTATTDGSKSVSPTSSSETKDKTKEELAGENAIPVPTGVTLDSAAETDEGNLEFKLTDSQAPRADAYDQAMRAAGWTFQETKPINSIGYRYTGPPGGATMTQTVNDNPGGAQSCAVVKYLIAGEITVIASGDAQWCIDYYNGL